MPIISIRDYIYFTLLLILIVFGIYEYNHLIDEGIARETAAYTLAGQRAEAAAEAKIVNLNIQHAADAVKVKADYEAQHEADVAQSATDADRLREYDIYRKAHPVVGCAAPGTGAATGPVASDNSDDQRLRDVEQLALELAAAGRVTLASLNSCLADRHLLTGK